MFEEDAQWCEEANATETSLHRKLFGDLSRSRKKQTVDPSKSESSGELREVHVCVANGGTRKRKREADKVCKDSLSTKKKSKQRPSVKRVKNDGSDSCNNHSVEGGEPSLNRVLETSQSKEIVLKQSRKKSSVTSKLYSKMSDRLDGSRFRMINEKLYTSTGAEAKQLFDEDPALFGVYHAGFAAQVSKWPSNPLDSAIEWVSGLPLNFVVADMGCGEGRLAQSVPHTVYSFDLVSRNEHITACNMANVPLPSLSVDVVLFCLSLMGSNISDFLCEARRLLKKGGQMRIYEVVSRFSSVDDFMTHVEMIGFQLLERTTLSKMFLQLTFRAAPTSSRKKNSDTSLPPISLKPCFYKRR